MPENQKKAVYARRINRAVDFIEVNAATDLDLARIAEAASFSPFHFHRIFRAMVGETVNQFVTRVRLERAARDLKANKSVPITNVALDAGFSSSSTFARAFQAHFGMSATQWRRQEQENSKIRKGNSKPGKVLLPSGDYAQLSLANAGAEQEMAGTDLDVEVKELRARTVAYVRRTGDFQRNPKLFSDVWGPLMTWAGARGLLRDAETLCVFHDDPDVTEGDRMRVSACITVAPETGVSGEVGKMTIAAGQYACGRFHIAPHELPRAWQAMFGEWLPQSGFEPTSHPCFELYGSGSAPSGRRTVEICIPVKPLQEG